MSETMSAERDTSGAGAESTTEPRSLKLAAAVILFALALAVVTLRFHRLDELPPGLYFDEGANGLDALQVLRGKHAIYFPENFGREPLGIYLMALAVSILGRTELAIRIPTALASGGTIFAVFWLGRLLFGRDGESGRATPWRGLLVGGVGAGLLAVSLARRSSGARRSELTSSLCCSLCAWPCYGKGGGAGAGGGLRWQARAPGCLPIPILRLDSRLSCFSFLD